jgi:hypothetical protein
MCDLETIKLARFMLTKEVSEFFLEVSARRKGLSAIVLVWAIPNRTLSAQMDSMVEPGQTMFHYS